MLVLEASGKHKFLVYTPFVTEEEEDQLFQSSQQMLKSETLKKKERKRERLNKQLLPLNKVEMAQCESHSLASITLLSLGITET